MRANAVAFPLGLSARLFRSHGKLNRRLAIAIFVVASIQAGAVALTCWIEGSWFLGENRGFSQHYGAWVILITDPLLLVASGFLDRQFLVAMTTLPLRPGGESRRRMRQLLRRYLPYVRANGPSILLYALLVVAGIYFWTQNFVQTIDPTGPNKHAIFKHHDVFDSGTHPWSFAIFKTCLFISWVIIYPIVGFKFLTVTLSTFFILRHADTEHLVCPRVELPDCCYGLKNIGTLNISILAPYLLVFSAIFALWITHEMVYGSILFALVVVSVIFLVTSYIVIQPVYSMLCRARAAAYTELMATSTHGGSQSDADFYLFAAKRFFYSVATASPYTDGTKALIFAMRATPVLALGLKLFR